MTLESLSLHWWQNCFTLVAKSPCIVGLICLSLINKGESKIQEIALDTGRICCELIRSDPGVFEFAWVAKWPYIGGLIYLSLNNKSESKIQETALDTGRICCELIRSESSTVINPPPILNWTGLITVEFPRDNCRTSQRELATTDGVLY